MDGVAAGLDGCSAAVESLTLLFVGGLLLSQPSAPAKITAIAAMMDICL